MKSLEEKLEWLKTATAEERALAIDVFRREVSLLQNYEKYVYVDQQSLPLQKEFVKLLSQHFPCGTPVGQNAQHTIAKKVKDRVASHRRRKSKAVKSTSIELTKEGFDVLRWFRKSCKASKNLVVDSILKDELDYTAKLKNDIKTIKQEQRQLRAENRELNNKVKRLETENQYYILQLESLGKLQRAAYQERQLNSENDNDSDDLSLPNNQDDSQGHNAELDDGSVGSEIESDTSDGDVHDTLLDDSANNNKEAELATNRFGKVDIGNRFLERSTQHQDPDIPAKEGTRMRGIYNSDENNKKLKFDE